MPYIGRERQCRSNLLRFFPVALLMPTARPTRNRTLVPLTQRPRVTCCAFFALIVEVPAIPARPRLIAIAQHHLVLPVRTLRRSLRELRRSSLLRRQLLALLRRHRPRSRRPARSRFAQLRPRARLPMLLA